MARDTTSDTRNFNIFSLKKWGKLEPGCVSNASIIWYRGEEETSRIGYKISTMDDDSYIELDYRTKWYGEQEWRPIKYKVPLERVKCHFGGVRWYFVCPLFKSGRYCGRRVAVLYKAGDYFGCRHCADLTYDSCNESKRFRGFPFGHLAKALKSDELLEKVGYTHYRGKPTRKYRRYLKAVGYMNRNNALDMLDRMLEGGKI